MLTASRSRALGDITGLLTEFTNSLGKDVVKKCETLVCFRGVHPTTNRRRGVCTLLVMARYGNPILQFLAKCSVYNHQGEQVDVLPAATPFTARVRVGGARMSSSAQAVETCTSEELCLELVMSGMSWTIVPLKWEVPPDDKLMSHTVVSLGEPFVRQRHVARRKPNDEVMPIDTDDDLFNVDPLQHGYQLGSQMVNQRPRVAPNEPAHSAAPPVADAEFADYDGGMSELFEGVPPEVVDAVSDEMLDSSGVHVEDEEPEQALFDTVAPGEDGASDSEGFAEAADTEHQELASPAAYTPTEALAFTTISPLGYVSCSVAPWDARPCIGRVTDWPNSKPREQRSCQASCYLHTRCRTPAKLRRVVSDQQLLLWLLSGSVEPDASGPRRAVLGSQHTAMFPAVLASQVGAAGTASSASGSSQVGGSSSSAAPRS